MFICLVFDTGKSDPVGYYYECGDLAVEGSHSVYTVLPRLVRAPKGYIVTFREEDLEKYPREQKTHTVLPVSRLLEATLYVTDPLIADEFMVQVKSIEPF